MTLIIVLSPTGKYSLRISVERRRPIAFRRPTYLVEKGKPHGLIPFQLSGSPNRPEFPISIWDMPVLTTHSGISQMTTV